MTALVVNVSGILFIVETLLRRDEGAGRIWALGFLAAMLTTLSYMVWAQGAGGGGRSPSATPPSSRARAACGSAPTLQRPAHGILVVARRPGGRRCGRHRTPRGPDGGDWAGAVWMFVALLLLAAAGATECVRGALLESRTAWVLAAVLGVQSLYYVSRTTAFLTAGPDSALFENAFGTVSTSFLTIVLTIVAVVATSVLRATRAPMRGYLRPGALGSTKGGILSRDLFEVALAGLCERAGARSELVGVIAVRVEDLDQISTAFGSEVARAVTETWRTGVRRHAPSNALVGEDGATGLVVAVLVETDLEARRQAGAIYRGLFDDLGKVGGE
nr:hypothetical protein GCM10025699_24940 [Microbacterium flavescens]